jgi:hypothetical protein
MNKIISKFIALHVALDMIDCWKISTESCCHTLVYLFANETSATTLNLLPKIFYVKCKLYVDVAYS